MNEIKIKDTKNLLFALIGCSVLPVICSKNQVFMKKDPQYIARKMDIESQTTLPKRNHLQNASIILILSMITYLYFNFSKFSFQKKCLIGGICLIVAASGIFGFIPAICFLVSSILNITFWFTKIIIWPGSA